MTLTVRALGWTFHVEATTNLDAEPCGDVAMGFVPGWVGE